MPTYEYRCPKGHRFERFQKISDPPEASCPTCGRPGERLISAGAGLLFKGSGFYITDYGKDGKGPRKPEKEGSGDAKSSEGKGPKDAKAPASDQRGSSSGSSSKKPSE